MATRCRSSCTSMFSKRGIRGRRLYIDTQHRGEKGGGQEPHAPSWRSSDRQTDRETHGLSRGRPNCETRAREGGGAVAGKHDEHTSVFYVCVSGGLRP
eukprot:scaffold40737_cov67-Phaeocystis_antarctica.AAC.2